MKYWIIIFMIACGQSFYYIRGEAYGGDAERIGIWVDPEFGEADRRELMNAETAWNIAFNGTVMLEDDRGDADWRIYKIDSGDLRGIENVSDIKDSMAWIDIKHKDIYLIRDRMDNSWVMGIGMHAMGHLLGAGEGGRLMNEEFKNRYACVDWGAISDIADRMGIDKKYLNYCVFN